MDLEKVILDAVLKSVEKDERFEQTLMKKLESKGIYPNATRIEVKSPRGTKVVDDPHKDFKKVLKVASAGLNVAMIGPAGSGKTTIARQVAESLDLEFYSKSVSAQTGVHEFFGYQDANGKYVPTLFRKAYENGGVFLLDEFDAGNPNVLASMNQATANGKCAFADGMVNKHKDFIFMAAGNTYGSGATFDYVGRNRIDAATLDRFVFVNVTYDEDLEKQICGDYIWALKVQKARQNAIESGVKCVISPRASIFGAKLLKRGLTEVEVAGMTIFKGLSKDEIELISKGIKFLEKEGKYLNRDVTEEEIDPS